jgi:hypothetical protein
LGKDARHWRSSCSSCPEKRSAHTGGPKEAFPANESSLGGKKESRRKTKSVEGEKGCAYSCRPKETFRAYESALGGEKESRLEIATTLATSIVQLLVD